MRAHENGRYRSRVAHMLRPLVSVVALLALTATGCAAALAQEPLSTRQMENLKPSQANSVVRKDLLSVFEPVHEISSGMFLRLHGVMLSTRPYGTEFDGLCRRDTLWLHYAPVDLHAPQPDQPLQPYGFEATAEFHAVRLPVPRPEDAAMQEDVWNKDCDRIPTDEDAPWLGWFGAKNTDEAARGLHALAAAADQVRAGQLKPSGCQLFGKEDRNCSQIVLDAGDIEDIGSVESCDAEVGEACYEIDVGSTEFTITIKPADEGLVPKTVVSIRVEQYVIVT